ncbi:MAG: hypothetical protein DRJ05_01365 [Bacteroidetes bacterium]|nr:MAG: hypothetical protein DRJ05_01365 [Bacteroidota bacterium]
MINALLVCDNNDSNLGDFFEKCKVETERLLASSDFEFNNIEVSGNAVFEIAVPMNANAINSNPFLFVSYTHGSENELLKNGNNPFLSIDNNVDSLKNSFAYCYACKAGRNLGKEFCANGSLCFIGYKEDVTVQKFFGAEDAFIECAVCGIEALVEGNTTGQALIRMKEKYTECIDDFYLRDMLTATLFMENRDALVLHGDTELTIEDF